MKRPKNTRTGGAGERVAPELVDRARRGDEVAWSALVEATYREVYTLCLRILGHPEDAAEATQDAYLKAFRGLEGFRGEALFTTWLYRVASNAAISKQRARTRRRGHETEIEEVTLQQIASASSTESAATARVEVEALEGALQALPEHYRVAVVLRDVYDLGIEEISRTLGISETAAKVRVHRGRKRLREMVYGEEAG